MGKTVPDPAGLMFGQKQTVTKLRLDWMSCIMLIFIRYSFINPIFLIFIYERGTPVFLNLDLISGMKYVHLLTENSLVKDGVLRKIFRFLQIHITE